MKIFQPEKRTPGEIKRDLRRHLMKGKIAIAHAYMKPYRGGVKEVYNDEGQIYVTVIYPDGDCEDVLSPI